MVIGLEVVRTWDNPRDDPRYPLSTGFTKCLREAKRRLAVGFASCGAFVVGVIQIRATLSYCRQLLPRWSPALIVRSIQRRRLSD